MESDMALRRLSHIERVILNENNAGSMIMVGSTQFTSDVDLFKHLPQIDQAIQTWKSIHPLLRCKVVEIGDELHYAYADDAKINSLDNVTYMNLVDREPGRNDYWRLFLEHEANSTPVNTHTGLMWRLVLIRSTAENYSFIVTINHAITDGLNSLTIVDQLLGLIDQSIDRIVPSDVAKFPSPFDIEDFYLKKAPRFELKSSGESSGLLRESRIPDNLAPKTRHSTSVSNLNDRFIDVRSGAIVQIRDLQLAEDTVYETRVKTFRVDSTQLSSLLAGCKSVGAKLTGCLTVVTALAVRRLYERFDCLHLADKVYVKIMASSRSQENVGNLDMGFWAVSLKMNIGLDGLDEPLLGDNFWKVVKRQSDALHEKINNDELVKYVLTQLASDMNREVNTSAPIRGAGVHFAFSNKGNFKTNTRMKHLKLTDCFSTITCPDRSLSPAVFHGIYTINNELCWSLGYNANLISEPAIEFLISAIGKIIEQVLNFC